MYPLDREAGGIYALHFEKKVSEDIHFSVSLSNRTTILPGFARKILPLVLPLKDNSLQMMQITKRKLPS
jgi:hypothetical protein